MTIIRFMVPEIWSVTESLSFWTISLPFYPPNNSENQIFEKMKKKKKKKKPKRNYHFKNVYHKWQSCDVWFLRYKARLREFLSFWTIFCPFAPLATQKIKFSKNEKNTWTYYFTHVYHKWQSYDTGIFPSTFLEPVNDSKNSKLKSSKKNRCHCR